MTAHDTPRTDARYRWDLYSAADGKALAGSDGVTAANEQYPNATKYATTQRRAFIRGFAAGREAAALDVERLAEALRLTGYTLWDNDAGYAIVESDLAEVVAAYARLSEPSKEPRP